jgi:hypothetical protein
LYKRIGKNPFRRVPVSSILMEDKVKEEIRKKAKNNRLPCPVAREIARKLSVPYGEVGRTADELKIKITQCELGCF